MHNPADGKFRLGQWFHDLFSGKRQAETAPTVPAQSASELRPTAPPKTPAPAKLPAQPSKRVPGNFYIFELFVELNVSGKVHLGYPCQELTDSGKNPPVIRWGSRLDLSWPNPKVQRIPWIDDPERGLAKRKLTAPEDLVGAEGTIGGRKYRFERVLDLGNNQVVYSLFNPDTNSRIAYGFPREIFSATEPMNTGS